jgi:hypothetical protein
MPKPDHEEKQLLELLKLIDAHRRQRIDADQLDQAIRRIRSGIYPSDVPRICMTLAAVLAAATLLFAIS